MHSGGTERTAPVFHKLLPLACMLASPVARLATDSQAEWNVKPSWSSCADSHHSGKRQVLCGNRVASSPYK